MLDELDQMIFEELQKDGRKSYTDIAKAAGVSEATIRKRVKDLKKSGVIEIRALLNPVKIGYSLVTILGFQIHVAELGKVAHMLAQKPTVRYLAFAGGRYDLVALVVSRKPEELAQFIKELSTNSTIIKTEAFVNLEIIKTPWLQTWDIRRLIRDSDVSVSSGTGDNRDYMIYETKRPLPK